jgi:DNA polymerase-3 subunit epsilon
MESAGGSIDQLFRSYLSPASEVVWRSGRVHGITPQDLVGAPALVELWGEIDPRLRRRVVLAHGAGTEKKFLRAFPLHGFGPWLDTLMLARRTLPGLADHSLRTCCTALGLEDEARVICAPVCGGLDWHDALFDTVACMLLFRAVITSLDLWDLPVSGLVEMGVVKGL